MPIGVFIAIAVGAAAAAAVVSYTDVEFLFGSTRQTI